MRKYKKHISILILILVLSLTLVGCSSKAEVLPPKIDQGAEIVEITGECNVETSASSVVVSSDANIIDGSIVVISVNGMDSNVLAEKEIVKSGDNLTAEFAIEDDWGDEIFGFVVMTIDSNGKQADHVYLAYGENFEKVKTENMLFDGKSTIVVFQSEKTKIR